MAIHGSFETEPRKTKHGVPSESKILCVFPRQLLGYILDRDSQVTFMGLKFGQSLLLLNNHLYSYLFGFLNFCITFLGLKSMD